MRQLGRNPKIDKQEIKAHLKGLYQKKMIKVWCAKCSSVLKLQNSRGVVQNNQYINKRNAQGKNDPRQTLSLFF